MDASTRARRDEAFLAALFMEDDKEPLALASGAQVPPAAALLQQAEECEHEWVGELYTQWTSDNMSAPSPPLLRFPSLEYPPQQGQAQQAPLLQPPSSGNLNTTSAATVIHIKEEPPTLSRGSFDTAVVSSRATSSDNNTGRRGSASATLSSTPLTSTSRGSSVGRVSSSSSALGSSSLNAAAGGGAGGGGAGVFSPPLPTAAATSGFQALGGGGGGGTSAGWQALLQKMQEAEAPILPVQLQGPRRGRKPKHVVNGVAIAKPVKDKKRENSILIKQLEVQLAEKLTLVKGLEGENKDLKRQEKILQISVDTSERNLCHLQNPELGNLEPMLKSFRSTYNKSAADRVLCKAANLKNGERMTFELFASCWQAIVMEMCDALVADATAATEDAKKDVEQHLQALQGQMIDFIMAVCATNMDVIRQAKSRNLCTGEPHESYEFWEGVVEKLTLSHEQLLDLIEGFDMFARLFERNLRDRRGVKEELSRAMAADEEVKCPWKSEFAETKAAVAEASEKLAKNIRQCGVLHGMLSFLSMRILDYRQCAQLCMHSSPYFPSIVHMQVVIRRTAERLGIRAPSPTTQRLMTRFQTFYNMPPRGTATPVPGIEQPAS